MIDTYNSPQGDGNAAITYAAFLKQSSFRSIPTIPRKGTETIITNAEYGHLVK